MQDINSVVLSGRLTRDVDVKATSTGLCVFTFSIANNRSVKKNGSWVEEASYFDVVWFSTSEPMAQLLRKGTAVVVQGKIVQDKWTGEDGTAKSRIKIYADILRLAGDRPVKTEKEQSIGVVPHGKEERVIETVYEQRAEEPFNDDFSEIPF